MAMLVEEFKINQAQITAMTPNKLHSKISELNKIHRWHLYEAREASPNMNVYNKHFAPTLAVEAGIIETLKKRLNTLKNRAMMLYQAFSLSIPSSKTQSTQKVLKSIESLQDFLKQDFLTRQYL